METNMRFDFQDGGKGKLEVILRRNENINQRLHENLVLRNSKDPNYKNKFKRLLIKIKMI